MSSALVFRLERIALRLGASHRGIRPQGRKLPASRFFSSKDDDDDDKARPLEWRKQQLDKLEKKFQDDDVATKIQDEKDLQPMWQNMEKRVKNRRSRTLEENKGKIGRTNVRKTDEDVWLQEGLYDDENGNGNDDNNIPSK